MARSRRRASGPSLRLQHQVWSVRFRVPDDVRGAFDGRSEIYQTLKTGDLTLAERKAAPILTALRARVLEARGRTQSFEAEALHWRDQIARARAADPEGGAPQMDEHLAQHAAEKFVSGGYARLMRSGVLEPWGGNELAAVADLGGPKAQRFISIALGHDKPTAPFIEPYLAHRKSGVEPKTLAMEATDLREFAADFPTLDTVTRRSIAEWIDKRAADGMSASTIKRKLSGERQFWTFLQSRNEVEEGPSPFDKVKVPEKAKAAAQTEREAFAPKDVTRCYVEAISLGDAELADLIALGAYTGARIEELCALKVDQVAEGLFKIADAKTKAGIREVPVHPAIKPLVARLIKGSKDGYVLSGLVPNKYGARSAGISKRFGRLKRDMGFTERHVFHSIRKTVSTLLERAGIPENVSADILGHEKPRMTYGLYSEGSSIEQLRKAIACLAYPGALAKVGGKAG